VEVGGDGRKEVVVGLKTLIISVVRDASDNTGTVSPSFIDVHNAARRLSYKPASQNHDCSS
jgi:hypothetical protein